jgi:hypothetical protein
VRGFLYALRLRGIPVTQLAVREGWNTWYLRRGCTPTLFRYLEVHSSTNMSSCLLTSSSPWSCVSPCIMAKHVINRDGCLCPLINHQQHHHYHLSENLHTRNPEHRYKTNGHFLHNSSYINRTAVYNILSATMDFTQDHHHCHPLPRTQTMACIPSISPPHHH